MAVGHSSGSSLSRVFEWLFPPKRTPKLPRKKPVSVDDGILSHHSVIMIKNNNKNHEYEIKLEAIVEGKIRYELDQLSNIDIYDNDNTRKHHHTRRRILWEQAPFLEGQFYIRDTAASTMNNEQPNNHMNLEKAFVQSCQHDQLRYECESSVLPPLSLDMFERVQTETHCTHVVRIVRTDPKFQNWFQSLFDTQTSTPLFKQYVSPVSELKKRYVSTLIYYRTIDPVDLNYEKALLLTLIQVDPSAISLLLRLAFAQFMEKDYENAQLILESVYNELTNMYIKALVSIILGLLYRINLRLQKALSCLRFAVSGNYILDKVFRTNRMEILVSGVWYWLGIVCEDLRYQVWAASCYWKCLHFMDTSATMEHPFVITAAVYLRLAEIHASWHQFDQANKLYIISFEKYTNDKNETIFIQLSPFRVQYQKASIAVRIAKILFQNQQFSNCEQYLKRAERGFLKLRYIESQGDGSDLAITDYLHQVHRVLAITYCHMGNIHEAKRYVKFHSFTTRIEVPQDSTGTLTYQQQLKIARARKQQAKREKKAYARGVVDQENCVAYLSVAIISLRSNDRHSYYEICNKILDPISEKLFSEMPIIIWQKLISQLIIWGQVKRAQLMMSKALLFHPNYCLGWYVLLILSILCKENTFIKGSYDRLMKLCPGARPVKFWTYVLLDQPRDGPPIQQSKL